VRKADWLLRPDARTPAMSRVAAVVLAAGGASRMGSPKQLLRVDGESLVRRATQAALSSRCAAVFVVVGAHAQTVLKEVDDLAVERVENRNWPEGLGASIRAGVEAVAATKEPFFDAALLILTDQVHVTTALLDRLIAAIEASPAGLVACEYGGTMGSPAAFSRRYFDSLCRLHGDHGAKAVLLAHAEAVLRIPFPEGAIDVDTPADYERLKRARPGPDRE
jgi:molybdenum cofactor cytidylyltransferase